MRKNVLAAYGGVPVAEKALRFEWPRITPEIEQIVLHQLKTDI